ncbi:MAG: DUF5667 domain-containing protein [Candidatus Gracilibacteria bacterium]
MFDPKKELSPQELEAMERLLTGLQPAISPSREFTARMQKRLERHYTLIQEGGHVDPSDQPVKRGFFSFIGTHAYSVITAFTFVIFTGGLSTFAYTSQTVTNGSPLYPIKRGLETIESTFASTPETRAEYQIKLLSRRLAESRFLTIQGVVDEPTNQDITFAVDGGIQAIQAVGQTDYRDQLLDRITMILRDEEKRFYSDAGVPMPTDNELAPESSPDTVESISSARESLVTPSVTTRTSEPSREFILPTTTATPAPIPTTIPVVTEKLSESGDRDEGDDDIRMKNISPKPENTELSQPINTSLKTDIKTEIKKESPSINPTTPKNKDRDTKNDQEADVRDNIAIPLHVKPGVIEALRKNRQHFKTIEIRLTEVRRRR